MGGNLFKLGRKPRAEYLEIEAEVRAYLEARAPGQYRVPRYYASKPDFGDLDVILPQGLLEAQPHFLEVLRIDLKVERFKSVGRVYSTVYREFQVDYFRVPDRFLDSTYNYLSFNDLGNLIGRICRRFNLKYGEEGLCYVYRRAHGNYLRDLEITRDFRRICAFLGLRYSAWEAGFETLPQMFEWVIESPFFSVKPYLSDSNDPVLDRSKQRTTVERFIQYLQDHGVQNAPPFKDRSEYLLEIDAAFPEVGLPLQLERERAAEAQAAQFQARFNGALVMNLLPHLSGPRLGEFIVAFKSQHEDFEGYVLGSSDAELRAALLEFDLEFSNGVERR